MVICISNSLCIFDCVCVCVYFWILDNRWTKWDKIVKKIHIRNTLKQIKISVPINGSSYQVDPRSFLSLQRCWSMDKMMLSYIKLIWVKKKKKMKDFYNFIFMVPLWPASKMITSRHTIDIQTIYESDWS